MTDKQKRSKLKVVARGREYRYKHNKSSGDNLQHEVWRRKKWVGSYNSRDRAMSEISHRKGLGKPKGLFR